MAARFGTERHMETVIEELCDALIDAKDDSIIENLVGAVEKAAVACNYQNHERLVAIYSWAERTCILIENRRDNRG